MSYIIIGININFSGNVSALIPRDLDFLRGYILSATGEFLTSSQTRGDFRSQTLNLSRFNAIIIPYYACLDNIMGPNHCLWVVLF